MKTNDRDRDYMRKYFQYVWKGEPHPGKPPRRIAESMAEAVRLFNEARPVRERQAALEAAFYASGGSEEAWNTLGVRAEQAASRATHGDYTRAMVLDILEAEIIG